MDGKEIKSSAALSKVKGLDAFSTGVAPVILRSQRHSQAQPPFGLVLDFECLLRLYEMIPQPHNAIIKHTSNGLNKNQSSGTGV